MPFQFIVRTYTASIEGCCGVQTLYGLEAHYETFRPAEGKTYPDLQAERNYLHSYGFLKFEKKFPEEAARILSKCTEHLKTRLYELSRRPAALYVTWFVLPQDGEDSESYQDCYMADTLRIAMLRYPGATDMGAFINPNTDNIIQGIQLADVPEQSDHSGE